METDECLSLLDVGYIFKSLNTFLLKELVINELLVADINEFVANKAALALVDGNKLWDMHRPFEDDCSVTFLQFLDPDPHHVNRAYWRSCSFLLGAVAETCFKDNVQCILHSFPSPNGT